MPFDGTVALPQLVIDLEATKEILLRFGWCPKMGNPIGGPHCIVTATCETDMEYERRSAVWASIARLFGEEDVAEWNDKQKSRDDVIAAIDMAIAKAL